MLDLENYWVKLMKFDKYKLKGMNVKENLQHILEVFIYCR